MKTIRDYFVEMGTSAEGAVDRSSDQADALNKRKQTYQAIETQFEQLAADGVIDPKEMKEILDQLRGAGLDTGQLQGLYQQLRDSDGHVGKDGVAQLSESLGLELNKADADVSDKLADLSNQVHQLQFFIDTGFGSASDYDKKQNDCYMAIIKNMAG